VVTSTTGSSTLGWTVESYVQDMASTGWTKTTVASINHDVPNIFKRNVYYIELTVRKGGVLAPGKVINSFIDFMTD
jgi:hypothetical protein